MNLGELVHQGIELIVHAGGGGKFAAGAADHVCCASLGGHAAGIAGGFADLAEAPKDPLFFGELFFLTLAQGGSFDLIGLVGKKIHLPQAGGFVHVILLPLVREFFPCFIGGCGLCKQGSRCGFAVGIHGPALGIFLQQALVFALSVNINKQLPDLAELL